MKRILLLLPLFFCTLAQVFSQHYYPLRPQDTTYHSLADSSVFLALKIDSSKTTNGESTHYLFKQYRYNDGRVLHLGASWLGDTIHTSADGWVTFVNRENKPIRIRYVAALGESWVAYEGNKWSANAKVTSYSKETLVGLTDSVKTITFDIRKKDGSDTVHPYDYLSLKLSKNFGIVQVINFYIWDAPLPENYTVRKFKEDTVVMELSLVGMENAKRGLRSLEADELIRYEVGDRWDVTGIYMRIPGSIESYVYDYHMYNVIAKDTGIRPTVYSIEHMHRSTEPPTTTNDTLVGPHPTNFMFLPGIPNTFFGGIIRIEKWLGRRIKTRYPVEPLLEPCLTPERKEAPCLEYWVEGIGGYFWDTDITMSAQLNKLTYYKKRDGEWGKPLVLVLEEDQALDRLFEVYPNPSQGELNLKNLGYSGTVNFTLFDLRGHKVKEQATGQMETQLEVSDLPKGMYVFEIRSTDLVLKKGRIVLQ